jgi:hypothetical protein
MRVIVALAAAGVLELDAGCATTAQDTSPAIAPAPAGASPAPGRPAFGTYKDVTVHQAPGSAALLVNMDGTPAPAVRAMPPAQPSVTWAFATGECGSETWGGAAPAAIAAANVAAFVAAGKRYVVSTGGQAGTFTCGSDDAFERFLGRYASTSLEGVDFDIEGSQTADAVDQLVQRVKAAHARHPALHWSFTLATLGGDRAQSLAPVGVTTMEAIRRHGLADVAIVNLMVMDYGPPEPANCVVGTNGRCDMGRSAVHAAERLHADWGVPYARIALTPMIGGNDALDETFTLRDVDTVAAFVRAQGLAGVRFWSMDRDTDCPPGPASNACNTVGNAGPWGYTKRFLAQLGY